MLLSSAKSKDNVQANVVDRVRRTSWEGKDWLVVPTIMIKEGVLNGELVPADELEKFPAAWNGRPFVIEHPKDGNAAVSANDPRMMEQYRAGYIFGTEYRENDQSVPAEIWLDVKRTEKIKSGPELMRRILDGKPVEVSTGYFRDLEKRSGDWHGQAYDGIARNLRPDHLAALLDSQGACSWEDGCGCPRVNECEECAGSCPDRMVWTEPSELVYQAAEDEEVGQQDGITQKVKDALHTLASALGINGNDSQEDVETMARSKADMVDTLCTRLELNDDATEGLNGLSADVLRKILNAFGPDEEPEDEKPEEEEPMPQEEKPPEPEAEDEPETQSDEPGTGEEPQANEQPCADARFAALEEQIKALERRNAELAEWVETAGPVVQEHQEAQASEKARLVGEIMANERNAFDEGELEQFDVPTLRKMARSLTPANYAGQEGGPTANQKQDTRPLVAWSGNRAGKE
jgi:hypothetical protein